MKLDWKTQALIAVGSSIAANCTGCLEKTVSMARKVGVTEDEIGAAIDIGRRVRAGAAAKLDQFATGINDVIATSTGVPTGGCNC